MSRPGDASNLSWEEREAWIQRVRANFAAQRGEVASPEMALQQLEEDERAGRTLRQDTRLTPEEKARWGRAAGTLGIGVSELVRDVMERACEEILEGEPAGTR